MVRTITHWTINNNVISLSLTDKTTYYPTAQEIFLQKSNYGFLHDNILYEPLKTLPLRFSELAAHPTVKFEYNIDHISLSIVLEDNDEEAYIGQIDNRFVDYVIYNNVWKYVDFITHEINRILNKLNVNPNIISFPQYAYVLKELSDSNVNYIDNVSGTTSLLKKSTESIKPKGLIGNLYPYQISGTKWLDFMIRNGCGCILGDEMGLGKTLQIIAAIGLLKQRKQDIHCLVVCPISLLENWAREIKKFYPSLTTQIHYGAKRTGDYHKLLETDITIMPYSCSISDGGMLTMITWDLMIIDEAQNIKNPRAQRTKAIKNIKSIVPIAVTGTPFENHMNDIWSITDYVLPGYLGSLTSFEQKYTDDFRSADKLESLLTPLMIRRKVIDVAQDLPDRLDIPQPVKMTEHEALLYEDSRTAEEPLEELKNLHITKIQKLRTFCTHPCVYNKEYSNQDPTTISNKYSRLCELVEEIVDCKEKIVIFTSFTKMIDLLVSDLHSRFNVYTNYIDGRVPAYQRQNIIDSFTDLKGPGILVLNPKAVGSGLNITCANHAIHYNLEWNPAIEDQASARIYRRGQEKKVFIYRLYYIDTIEEIINEKIQYKRQLSDKVIVGNDGDTNKDLIIKALSVTPYK